MKSIGSIFKNLILWMIHHPRVTAGIGIFFLISLIWGIGAIEQETRLLLTMGVILLWSFFLMLDRWRTERGAKQIEAALSAQGRHQRDQTRPDRREEIEAIGEQFERAVASLKQSKLGQGGKAALYALPWYMIIGPPASGKSTALEKSGLQFPSMGVGGRHEIKGIGGTRNCDWWFTHQAVLLDTAGRYVTEDDDREEWLAFLALLKKHRKSKPINGVMAAISLADLLQADEQVIADHAKNIRSRIDELIAELGTVFPVYLLLTKCDLVHGFIEFFEDLNTSEREDILGVTLARNLPHTPKESFDAHWDEMVNALKERRLSRLATAWGYPKVKEVYTFPTQLASGKDRLSRFIEMLFQINPYQENPIFRGFYLTSGTQEGTPIDRILMRVSENAGLPIQGMNLLESQKEPKSYFIKKTLTDVIFPDQLMANPSSAHVKQRGYLRVGVFVGSVLVLILALTGGSFSFVRNNLLIGSLRKESIRTIDINAQDDQAFEQNIAQLDRLHVRLKRLISYEIEGIPFGLKGGLYRGDRLYPQGLEIYFQQFSKMLLPPTQRSMEIALQRLTPEMKDRGTKADFERLKGYLLLSHLYEPAQMDPEFLRLQLEQIWHQLLLSYYGNAIPKNLEGTIKRQISFYTSFLSRETSPPPFLPFLSPATGLISEARQVLRRVPLHERVYQQILENGEKTKWAPFTIKTALRNQGVAFLTEGYAVPGEFTVEGWRGDGGFTETMEQVVLKSSDEQWVLGLKEQAGTDIRTRILQLYFQDYIRHWVRFLSSLHLRDGMTISEIAKVTEPLSMDDSIYIKLLRAVETNTQLDKTLLQKSGADLFQKIKKKLKIEEQENEDVQSALNPVTARFRSLHEFVSPAHDEKDPPIVQYVVALGKVNEIALQLSDAEGSGAKASAQKMAAGETTGLTDATRSVERILLHFDSPVREALSPFLLQPFQIASGGVMSGTLADLNRLWSGEVYQPCLQGLSGRYPFRNVEEEAALADLASFFYPREGTLWRWVESEIVPFVERIQDRWKVKKGVHLGLSTEFLDSLYYAHAISERLFSSGSADLKLLFDIYPYPRRGVEEMQIRIDGTLLRYRNEPQEWVPFQWPGDSTGASLEVHAGGKKGSKQYLGQWGLFRLFDDAVATALNNTQYKMEWNIANDLRVRMDIKAKSYKNPFQRGLFSNFKCIARVG